MRKIKTFGNRNDFRANEDDLQVLDILYGDKNKPYVLAVYTKTEKFEKEFERRDSQKEYVFVGTPDLRSTLSDLKIHHYSYHQQYLYTNKSNELKLKMKKKGNKDNFVREPETTTLDVRFYLVSSEELNFIPFGRAPITDRREGLFADSLNDSIEMTAKLKEYIQKKFEPIQTSENNEIIVRYRPILKKDMEAHVPSTVNVRAFDAAIKHNLTTMEFNFLNYFYETGKAFRNGVAQTFYDVNQNGIGWGSNRKWVKDQMARLIELGLVEFGTVKDCRDGRYTSWYFYEAGKNLKSLKHDF